MVGSVHEYNILEIDQPIRPSRTTDQAYSSRVGLGSNITPIARVCRRRRLNREVIQLRLQKLRHRMSCVLHVHGRLQKKLFIAVYGFTE